MITQPRLFVSGIRTLHRRYGNDRALSHSLGTLSVSKVHAAEPTTVRRRIRPTPSRVGEARRRSKKELRGTCGFSSTSQSHGRRACGPCSVNAIENRVDKIPPRSLYRIQSKCSVHLRFVTKKSRCSLFTWLLSSVCVCGGGDSSRARPCFPGKRGICESGEERGAIAATFEEAVEEDGWSPRGASSERWTAGGSIARALLHLLLVSGRTRPLARAITPLKHPIKFTW